MPNDAKRQRVNELLDTLWKNMGKELEDLLTLSVTTYVTKGESKTGEKRWRKIFTII